MFNRAKICRWLVLACMSTLVSNGLSAQNSYKESYGFIRGAVDFVNLDVGTSDVSLINLGVRGGYMFIPNLGTELRVGTTIASDDIPVGVTTSEVKTDFSAALLGRIQATFDPGIVPYVALGVGTYKASADNSAGTSSSITATGFAGFFGVDFQFKNGLAAGADFGNLAGDATSLGLHVGLDF